jgi:parallel beta helix pectate lyase-like protein
MKLCWLAAATILLLPASASARTWHIQNDGSGDAPTIQAGIDSAAAGDTVLVGLGTYLENLSVIGKDLVLKSVSGPEATTLDGSSKQETVVYLSGQTRATVVEGFTITGGLGHFRAPYHLGGGFYLDNGASPTIRGNRVVANGVSGSTDGGGGLFTNTYLAPPISPLITGNIFQNNVADLGGGALEIGSGLSEIRNNIFRSNSCRLDGGAIYCWMNANSSPSLIGIYGNQFWSNSAGDHGGAIHLYGATGRGYEVIGNLFANNSAQGAGAGDTGSGGAIQIDVAPATISQNTFVDNVALGECASSGGGISMTDTPTDLYISENIFAFNRGGGISCRFAVGNTLGPNLFWMNQDGDLGSYCYYGTCPTDWATNQIFADPKFCNPEAGNYTVSIDSPALTGSAPMGVWTTPGCGPGVPVRRTTWGSIKARYR